MAGHAQPIEELVRRGCPATTKKALANHEGLFPISIFATETGCAPAAPETPRFLPRSSWGAVWVGRVALQTWVEPPLVMRPRRDFFFPAIAAFLRHKCAAPRPGAYCKVSRGPTANPVDSIFWSIYYKKCS